MLKSRAGPGKLFFAIDLDETVFVNAARADQVHPSHSLSNLCYPVLTDLEAQVSETSPSLLINVIELSMIFEKACGLGYQLIILTAGTYEKSSIIHLLQKNLRITSKTREKIGQARFHSSLTDCTQRTLEAMQEVVRMQKGPRIVALCKQFPELRGQWILFDDNPVHIDSCKGIQSVHAVLATTDEPNKACYQELIERLEKTHQQRAEINAIKSLIMLKKTKLVDKENADSGKKSRHAPSRV